MTQHQTPARPSTPRFALLVLLGAYPVITAILYALAPLTAGWAIWQKTLLVAPMMVATMVWAVIPLVHKRFQWFIVPSARTVRSAVALIVSAAAALGAPHRTAAAQDAPINPRRWELIVPSGTLLPTGAQRTMLKRADINAIQLAYLVRPSIAVTATAGWARSRDLSAPTRPKLDVFTYDIGAELRSARRTVGALALHSFGGAGAGARSYDYRGVSSPATHNLSAYLAAGGELGYRRVRLRIEARDYFTGFKPLSGVGAGYSRNDVTVMAGLRVVRG